MHTLLFCAPRALRKLANIGLFVAASILARAIAQAQTSAYTADFELSNGYAVGPFVSQGRWTISSGTAAVTNADKAIGAQSLNLARGGTVTVDVSNISSRVAFVDLFIRPVADVDSSLTTVITTDQTSIRFVRENSRAVVYFRSNSNQSEAV